LIVTIPFAITHSNEIALVNVSFRDLTPSAKKEVECLADNIFFESAYEPKDGKIAVGLVTMNRVKHGFDDSVCGVVKQKTKHTCQFSWWCETKARTASLRKEDHLSERQKEVYNEIKDIAVYVYMNYENIKDNTQGALYYHANYVNPRWKLKKTVTIGNHIFYTPY
jgi:spore germination cell wall hydrolase CwlJ-like protein